MVTALLLNMTDLYVEPKKFRSKEINEWIPSTLNCLKFNVDGSSRGNLGSAGIEGVRRDSNGMVLCLFSLGVGIMDSNATEILAIRRALEL
ncbi:hypothetical protein Dsin_016379 [Dipteronia sinensis]|uniref:RNase H type-1 domain-containing protein n=1 Tax=Dipteronia sinensis TaxID=43782 RepID=A0AAE0E6W6_9ROSI|nr:hypothetical protein Dsin_016379 [Dipteronia sinensis]